MQYSKEKLLSKNQPLLQVLMASVIGVFLILCLRLGQLQMVEGSHYQKLADNNRYFKQLIPAERGVIFDRYQQPLVQNQKIYFLNQDETLYSQREPVEAQQAITLMAQGQNKVSYELRRWYRYPWSLSHVLGYTAPIDKEDLLANEQLKANDWIGKMGLEKEYDIFLRGRDGFQMFEVDTHGQKQRLIKEEPSVSGQDINTGLDPYLSRIAYQSLGQQQGAVVILDADSGQVLSLVSKPSFNLNDLSYALTDTSLEKQRQLNIQNYFQDDRKVFFNRAVNGTYPPGSIFKMVVALAGLESDAIDEQQTVLDTGILRVNEHEYTNWLYTARGAVEGEIALVRAIARSNDIYFYKAAEWTGPTTIAEQARAFGFGQKTGLELPNEASGLVPDPAWKEKTTGERWFLGNTYHFGIGQGDMLTTPLQAAQMLQALVNQGQLCAPRLVKTDEADNCRSLGLSDNNLELVLKGMVNACEPGGTASLMFKYNQFLPDSLAGSEQLQAGGVACKTGTAEFGGLDDKGRRNTHAWFVAATTVKQEELLSSLETRLDQVRDTDSEQEFSVEELEDWLQGIEEHGFPRRVVAVALVESDENEPFKEGSLQAASVVESLFSYLKDLR